MSDLSVTLEALERSRSQLSVRSYFDDGLFRREHGAASSQRGPRYVGHELTVPEVGDYHALPQEGEGRALVRTPRRHRADLERLPPPPGGDAARARQHRHATSSARCTAGPTTSRRS